MKGKITNKLKVAFLGGGLNSEIGSVHFAAINLCNKFELVAGMFSRNKNINYETALNYRVMKERVYNSIQELIEKEKDRIDAAIIITSSEQHTSQAITLLENKIPVICEKPLSGSVNEARKLKNILHKNNTFLSVIYNYLGYPMIKELKNIIQQGKIGKIQNVQIEMPQESFIRINRNKKPRIPQKWRLKDLNVPTISLDLGFHLHILIKYLTDETPKNVIAKISTYGNFKKIIDNVNCIVEYSNNITCNMWYSKTAAGNRNGMRIRIFGKRGSADWVQENPEILMLADNKGNKRIIDRGNDELAVANLPRYTRFKAGHPAGFVEAFANYYQDIALAIRNYKEDKSFNYAESYGIEETLEACKLFEAIQKSGVSRTWIKV